MEIKNAKTSEIEISTKEIKKLPGANSIKMFRVCKTSLPTSERKCDEEYVRTTANFNVKRPT